METLFSLTEGPLRIIFGISKSIWDIFLLVWWLVIPAILFNYAWGLRLKYLRKKFRKKIKWVMLELRIPREVLKTPKSMEQVFASLAATYSFGPTPIDLYIEGKVETTLCFEMVGANKGVHFYLRVPVGNRKLVETAIYAQYPQAEISEVSDYVELFPQRIPNKKYDIFGTGYVFVKENYYPIRTYKQFEEMKDERVVDPIANITEVMSTLKDGEMIWIQYLLTPAGKKTGNDWQGEGKDKCDEIVGKKSATPKKLGIIFKFFEFINNYFIAYTKSPEWAEEKVPEKKEVQRIHPGDQETIKAISNKISKFGFETNIRFIYIAERSVYDDTNISAIMGTFHLFTDQLLNSLRPDKTFTKVAGWRAQFFPNWKKKQVYKKKRYLYWLYTNRRTEAEEGEKPPVLCTEELATLYHVPSLAVEAPLLGKIEARKSEPPANLPIEE